MTTTRSENCIERRESSRRIGAGDKGSVGGSKATDDAFLSSAPRLPREADARSLRILRENCAVICKKSPTTKEYLGQSLMIKRWKSRLTQRRAKEGITHMMHGSIWSMASIFSKI
jgi:hypothetical protein